jgi:hypothetical protein
MLQQIRYNRNINKSVILIENEKVTVYLSDLENELGECGCEIGDFQKWEFNEKVQFLKECRDSIYNQISDQEKKELEEFMKTIDTASFEVLIAQLGKK